MAATLPINQPIQISKKKDYSLVLSLCNPNATGEFSAKATPLFPVGLEIDCWIGGSSTTATATFTPSDTLHIWSGTKAPAGSTRQYPILVPRQDVSLSTNKSGTAVTTVVPFGKTYSPPVQVAGVLLDFLAAENAPSRYLYSVSYDGTQVANGLITIAISADPATPPPADFSICDVKVS